MNPGCAGKRQFLTFTQAKGAARNAQRHNNSPMRAYMCTSCHKFHIGNKPKSERPLTRYRRVK